MILQPVYALNFYNTMVADQLRSGRKSATIRLGDIRYVYTWKGERVFKVVSFFLVRYRRGRINDLPPEFRHEVSEARWIPLDEASDYLTYKSEREMALKAMAAL
jgi:hypothetical protein